MKKVPRYYYYLFGWFMVITIWSSINPQSSGDWILETIFVLIGMILFVFGGLYKSISKVSATLIVAYLILPIVGAHYAFDVPLGNYLGHLFHSPRNMYDRIVHFSSGLLGFYPLYEIIKKKTNLSGFWSYLFPVAILGAIASIWEVLEWLAAIHVNSQVGTTFLGFQGDIWDTQKDMAMEFIGLFIALVIVLIVNRKRKSP